VSFRKLLIGAALLAMNHCPTDSSGSRALLKASANLDLGGVQNALPHADVNATDGDGQTPLIIVSEFSAMPAQVDDKSEIVKILLSQAGINVNAVAKNGASALYGAAGVCDDLTAQRLLHAGADPSLRIASSGPNHGWSAFDAALEQVVNHPRPGCNAVFSTLPPDPGPADPGPGVSAVWLRLADAVCPMSPAYPCKGQNMDVGYKCGCKLADFPSADIDGDPEVWVSGTIKRPGPTDCKNYNDDPCFYPQIQDTPGSKLCDEQYHLCDPNTLRQYSAFTKERDFTFDIDLDNGSAKMIQSFLPPKLSPSPIHVEAVGFARSGTPGSGDDGVPLFRGWQETGAWTVLFDGAPFYPEGNPNAANEHFAALSTCPQVRVRGALVVDGHSWGTTVELHPISEIKIVHNGTSCPPK